MPQAALTIYVQRLPRLKAEMCVMQASISAYPHLKVSQQRRMMREWQRLMDRETSRGRVVPPAMLRAIGIGVIYVRQVAPGLQAG